jgi:hypothetical protein
VAPTGLAAAPVVATAPSERRRFHVDGVRVARADGNPEEKKGGGGKGVVVVEVEVEKSPTVAEKGSVPYERV